MYDAKDLASSTFSLTGVRDITGRHLLCVYYEQRTEHSKICESTESSVVLGSYVTHANIYPCTTHGVPSIEML